ncbi:MAG: UDP-N-acetylmuramoyl-L-alanyl-D-glutamate--2,6-diaminopimelate ligase [Clostridia bacterium]|nr:UDP-N-acetylmuramoyl-L-alanyl-D-glutamate--2,6-diaminopimelate ligase [Clostridia bacterium]
MELKEILSGIEGLKVKGSLDIEVSKIESSSKKIKEGDMFIAIDGFEQNGHEFIEDAIKNGAKVIMAQADKLTKEMVKNLPADITFILAPDTRHAISICACNYYQNPSRKLKLIGVTGTKGKTTTTFMIKSLLEKQGYKVGLIGTICTYIGDKNLGDNDRTTPESLELQQLLNKMVKAKCEFAVMEVSSQSLKLGRVDGCEFDIGIFTNFSKDHISSKEHESMEDYFSSKVKLFSMCKTAYINSDDIYANKLPSLVPECNFTTYGIDNPASLLAKDITITNSYVDFKVKLADRNQRVKTGIPGRFSVYNSLAAISVALKFGITAENIQESLLSIRVPGRSELVDNGKELTIMIDYAHSPESLESILTTVRSYTQGKVICVFGCGGDRDPGKRPIMGNLAATLADHSIITSDNPRKEKPEEIIAQIEEGAKKTKGSYECIVDRKEAIKKAIHMAHKKDIVVIAGKGHELTQEIKGKKYPFDEREIVKEILGEKEQNN